MTKFWPQLHERIVRLADKFHQLKERVREAVATEMGKVVADAVRDWITTILHPRLPYERFEEPRYEYETERDPEAWDEQDPWEREAVPADPVPVREEPPELPRVSKWAAALSVGVLVSKLLIMRRLPLAPALGLGVVLGAVALVGGPVIQASLAAATAAADLVQLTQGEHRPSL